MYKIAIIIPVFNASEYLKDSLDSIINQSLGFENVQIVIYDDCSTDNSREIIEEYASKYDNIFPFFSNENNGPSFGRNYGINNATAEYLLFADADDVLDKELCERLYSTATTSMCDICCSNVMRLEENTKLDYSNENNQDTVTYDGDEILTFSKISLHAEIFKKSFIDKYNIRFKEDLSAEDFIFNKECFIHAQKLIFLKSYHGYYYRRVENSLSSNEEYILGHIDANYYVLDLLKKYKKDEYIPHVFGPTLFTFLREYLWVNQIKKEHLIKFYEFEKDEGFKFSNNNVAWVNFINYFIIHKHFNIATFLMKIMQIVMENKTLKQAYRKIKRVESNE